MNNQGRKGRWIIQHISQPNFLRTDLLTKLPHDILYNVSIQLICDLLEDLWRWVEQVPVVAELQKRGVAYRDAVSASEGRIEPQ